MSNAEVIIALAALCVTLLGSLLVTVWKASSIVTRLETALLTVQGSIAHIEEGLSKLEKIPVHEVRIGQLERLVSSLAERVGELANKLQRLDKHFAIERAKSHPDLEEMKSDPPTST